MNGLTIAGASARRTHHTASARKLSENGITSTCACRSAKRKLQNGILVDGVLDDARRRPEVVEVDGLRGSRSSRRPARLPIRMTKTAPGAPTLRRPPTARAERERGARGERAEQRDAEVEDQAGMDVAELAERRDDVVAEVGVVQRRAGEPRLGRRQRRGARESALRNEKSIGFSPQKISGLKARTPRKSRNAPQKSSSVGRHLAARRSIAARGADAARPTRRADRPNVAASVPRVKLDQAEARRAATAGRRRAGRRAPSRGRTRRAPAASGGGSEKAARPSSSTTSANQSSAGTLERESGSPASLVAAEPSLGARQQQVVAGQLLRRQPVHDLVEQIVGRRGARCSRRSGPWGGRRR